MISRRGGSTGSLFLFYLFRCFLQSKLIILIKKGRLGYDSIVKRPSSSSGERSAKKLFCDQEDLTSHGFSAIYLPISLGTRNNGPVLRRCVSDPYKPNRRREGPACRLCRRDSRDVCLISLLRRLKATRLLLHLLPSLSDKDRTDKNDSTFTSSS